MWIIGQISYILPYSPKQEGSKRFFETLISNALVLYFIGQTLACCWIRTHDELDGTTESVYINGIYFLMATASTIGYGDDTVDKKMADQNPWLYVLATLIILIALNYFAYMQSLIWSMALDWAKIDGNMAESLEEFEDWMAVRNQTMGSMITFEFEKACKSYIKYMSNRDVLSKINYNGYMDAMPYNYQSLIKKYVTRELISSFDFFKPFCRETASSLCMQYMALK